MTKRPISILIATLFVLQLNASTLYDRFTTPPEEARPWTFWYWMYGSISRDGIRADLEAMKAVGLGGAYLMPIKGVEGAKGFPDPVAQLTPEWWSMVRYSFEEADRLGMKMGLHICDGFALAGGPWITPEESMQRVVSSDTIIQGGKPIDLRLPALPAYQGYAEDIALYAIPVEKEPSQEQPTITSSIAPGNPFAADLPFSSAEPCSIDYTYSNPYTCTAVKVVLRGNNYQAHRLRLSASDNGIDYRFVYQFEPARQGWQNTDYQTTHTIPPTTARFFRFDWTPVGSEPGSEDLDAAKWKPSLRIVNLNLLSEPRIHEWEGKAGGVWRIARQTTVEQLPDSYVPSLQSIRNLTAFHQSGRLRTTLPTGKWRILRIGHTASGHTNATGGAARGLECSKFDRTIVRKQLDNWFGQTWKGCGEELTKRVLRYMHIDSWECSSQNWSREFATEFKRRRGYDLIPYLPVMAGYPVGSRSKSESVLYDIRLTINDLVNDIFFDELITYARQKGVELSAESIAPTFVADGIQHYGKADYPMGEFWLRSPTHDKPNDMLDAINGGRIYGKRIVQAEGFTQLRTVWDEHPRMLKPLLDRQLALGINRLFFHVYVHNPYMDRAPGITLDGIGLYFQRNQTWWDAGKAFIDYTARCQAMLQYGTPVVDIAVFIGEEMPRRSVLPDRLAPMLPGLFGDKRIASEKIRQANIGQPMRIEPVKVNHSANMAVNSDWTNPLRGYLYDSFNPDALIRLGTARNQRLEFPGGASYPIVILPGAHTMNPNNQPLSPAVSRKIEELRRAGVQIPKLPYTLSDFTNKGIEPDALLPEGVAWTHRRGNEAEIYFIANPSDSTRRFSADLRQSLGQPELWLPATGERRAALYRQSKERTQIEMVLEAGESLFVVFSKGDKRKLLEPITQPVLIEKLTSNRWNIAFPSINRRFENTPLFDWSKSPDTLVHSFAGTAHYTTRFEAKPKVTERYYLELEHVDVIATVRINGKGCGVIWTNPLRIEVTNALQNGTNELQIDVTNTWANALRASDNKWVNNPSVWTNAPFRDPRPSLLPAGIQGEVLLVSEKR